MNYPPTKNARLGRSDGCIGMMPGIRAAMVSMIVLGAATPAAAQGIVGHLFDFETGVIVATADVVMTDPAGDTVGRAESDANGRFVILVEELGDYSLFVSRLGYVDAASARITLTDEQLQELEMTIRPEAVELEGILVSTEARVQSLNRMGFYERKKTSIGTFLVPSQDDKTEQFNTSGLLRSVPALDIRRGVVRTLRGGTGMAGTPCPMKVFVDGRDVGINLDESVISRHVSAIEVYKSTAAVPGQWVSQVQAGYLGNGGEQEETCGAVVVWTQFGRN